MCSPLERFWNISDKESKAAVGINSENGNLEVYHKEQKEVLTSEEFTNNSRNATFEFIKSLRENGFKIALASSGPGKNIRLILQGLGIENYFDAVVSGEDVTEGKPNPQCFLLAAQKLGITPKDCIVIEDAVAGVAAAGSAGMHCIAITNTHPAEKLKPADLIVDSLEKITIQVIERLLASKNKSIS